MKLAILILCPFTLAMTCLQSDSRESSPRWDFKLNTPANPADPDPTEQADAQRLETLRKRVKEAAATLESSDYRKFFNDYVDPTLLVRQAAASNSTDVPRWQMAVVVQRLASSG